MLNFVVNFQPSTFRSTPPNQWPFPCSFPGRCNFLHPTAIVTQCSSELRYLCPLCVPGLVLLWLGTYCSKKFLRSEGETLTKYQPILVKYFQRFTLCHTCLFVTKCLNKFQFAWLALLFFRTTWNPDYPLCFRPWPPVFGVQKYTDNGMKCTPTQTVM